ncbi:2,3-bisphosphoglycerate-independent phosphoglycerate mutase, partial [Ferrovibrio sp.]|uniref:2,3-bisphosphoglycerate-independent phosphoglycerate mutase n=1 Tax=Ferrovibrio sp. TaxID=1917215 RepID=UPI0026313583
QAGVKVWIHMFADGRDTAPKSALGFLAQFRKQIAGVDGVAFATVSGRFFAMDRDKRWERVAQAHAALVDARGRTAASAEAAIEQAYAAAETDEFISPTAVTGFAGMQDGDGLLMANFRADRAREILTTLLDPHFDGFSRGRMVKFAGAVGLTEYSAALNAFLATAYPPVRYPNVLGQVLANAGKTQLRIAETEKYAHVTFFMNGGEEQPFAGEDRILVPSPKVKTYDLQPEMSAPEMTDKLVAAITAGQYDLIIVNYANPDMVGHTGSMPAAIRAAETVDACVGRVEAAVKQADGVLLITADHGNLEEMLDRSSGQAHTQHTTNPVPLLLTGGARTDAYALSDGRLCDIAPTLLHFLGLAQPAEMTGHCLARPGAAANQNTARRLA